jgi:hypothetical protein
VNRLGRRVVLWVAVQPWWANGRGALAVSDANGVAV